MKKPVCLLVFFMVISPAVVLFCQDAGLLGDVNDSGSIDIVDALLVAQYYVGSGFVEIDSGLADVDGNGTVNIVDALLIAQYYVGIISEFPARVQGYELVRSDLERNTSPETEDGELAGLVNGNTAFALDFYRMIAGSEENIVFSPHSISVVMAMCCAGARGSTESQIANVMHFTLGRDRLHNAFNALDLELPKRISKTIDGEPVDLCVVNTANSLWGQTGYPFLDDFLDILAVNYDAGMHAVDFLSDPELCRTAINEWVAERTEGKIDELFRQGDIKSNVRLIIANTLYFKSEWHTKFDPANTAPGIFTLLDGTTVTAEMMYNRRVRGNGKEVPGMYKVGYLDFYNWNYSMVILLPETGRFGEIESSLTPETLGEMIYANTEDKMLEFTMPKFNFGWGGSIKDTLSDLGMTDAFTDAANLDGITTHEKLMIYDVIHKATIAVDENGTEATAATGATIGPPSEPPPMTIVVNRPFIFVIRSRTTGAILFAGRVLDPTK
ncbi:MAG: hypothetical protein JW881_04405 [Spirochaetales bacterium]|nr:hypothetical protein [Spirochaetales bacterium]